MAENKSALEVGGVVIDPERRTVNVYGEQVELTPKEFDILYLLASHPKKVYNVENIFSGKYGPMIILKAEIQLWYIFVRCGKNLGKIKERIS